MIAPTQESAVPPQQPASRNLQSQTWNAVLDFHRELFTRLNRRMIAEFGISLTRFDVLAQLYACPDGLTQGELSRRLKVTGGNVSGLVRRMAAENLIVRDTAPDDRRAVIVRATQTGRDTFLAARAHHDTLLHEWLGSTPDSHLTAICAELADLTARVATQEEEHIQ